MDFLSDHPCEQSRHYLPQSDAELSAMLKAIGAQSLEDLFTHLPEGLAFDTFKAPEELDYSATAERLEQMASRNLKTLSFIGDGLQDFSIPQITKGVSRIRKLSTAYTPYQPELSQGTLTSLWIYQCVMAKLTGFEAINCSLYERATALFEGLSCARRVHGKDAVAVAANLYPGDLEVLKTLARGTGMEIVWLQTDENSGRLHTTKFKKLLQARGSELAAVAFAQVNHFGLLEAVDELTDTIHEAESLALAVVDPLLLGKGGLKRPSRYGQHGADILVGEAQHLAIGPNFGGPGLGLFGVRVRGANSANPNANAAAGMAAAETKADAANANAANANKPAATSLKGGDMRLLRASAGRYVGKACDVHGKACFSMVLSTREQHIRKDRATSNICSNQAFLATLVGAALLERGDAGLGAMLQKARSKAERFLTKSGAKLAFPESPFFNELTLELKHQSAEAVLEAFLKEGILAGVDVSSRTQGSRELLKLSFSDKHSEEDVDTLAAFYLSITQKNLAAAQNSSTSASDSGGFERMGQHCREELPQAAEAAEAPKHFHSGIPEAMLRNSAGDDAFRCFDTEQLLAYYQNLGELNATPDEGIYPLGSCTMKYNPELNDYAANLSGFVQAHPQAPAAAVQGCLEVLYEIQNWIIDITGLDAVTTQPVAGAQGELVGLKLFQAYHQDKGELHRDVVFVPESAHGTNFATAAMAGMCACGSAKSSGLVRMAECADGSIDMEDFAQKLELYKDRLCGVMITNPNTRGLFEPHFKEISNQVRAAGGLVYLDGANTNAIAGRVDLKRLGVDAVHHNLHKTWSIPHGGGGPGDAIVAVDAKLADYLPGLQVRRHSGIYKAERPTKSIGSFHRHWGNFAHKVRALTYFTRLGKTGIPRISAVAVLAARYLLKDASERFELLPKGSASTPRMHEFILSIKPEDFKRLEQIGLSKAAIIPRIGKLFGEFGFHAPTVAWPEPLGLMIEPTESFTQAQLDRFAEALSAIKDVIEEHPEVLLKIPLSTPIGRVDEVGANRELCLSENLQTLPSPTEADAPKARLQTMSIDALKAQLLRKAAANHEAG